MTRCMKVLITVILMFLGFLAIAALLCAVASAAPLAAIAVGVSVYGLASKDPNPKKLID